MRVFLSPMRSFGSSTERSEVWVCKITIDYKETRVDEDGQKIFEMISDFVLEFETLVAFNQLFAFLESQEADMLAVNQLIDVFVDKAFPIFNKIILIIVGHADLDISVPNLRSEEGELSANFLKALRTDECQKLFEHVFMLQVFSELNSLIE